MYVSAIVGARAPVWNGLSKIVCGDDIQDVIRLRDALDALDELHESHRSTRWIGSI